MDIISERHNRRRVTAIEQCTPLPQYGFGLNHAHQIDLGCESLLWDVIVLVKLKTLISWSITVDSVASMIAGAVFVFVTGSVIKEFTVSINVWNNFIIIVVFSSPLAFLFYDRCVKRRKTAKRSYLRSICYK